MKNVKYMATSLKRLVFSCLVSSIFCCSVLAAPSADYWAYWDKSDENSYNSIDHSRWNKILQTYVIDKHSSGVNRFKYAAVTPKDQKNLTRYIKTLEKTDPRVYNRREQKAYWLNLYNAVTVKLVLDNYPIKSMQDIGNKMIKRGPWNKPLINVIGQRLSLNDIEHRILRPIWQDHKIHFGLSCASISCPNILPVAFTGTNVRPLLKQAGRDYINHPRGISLKNGKLKASSMFNWYQTDFAKSESKLMKVFAYYTEDKVALYLLGYQGKIDYNYDWQLNAP
ncbi:MAG: DUF547 domain-containing protein [Porticoccus sp.]|nr:DUF547 domain-containing protein [Porticoccus sp.]